MPKITPEDMDAVRALMHPDDNYYAHHPGQRDIVLASILIRIWDRGFEQGRLLGLTGCRDS